MPKYYDFMVSGYFLYFTAECIVEAMQAISGLRKPVPPNSL